MHRGFTPTTYRPKLRAAIPAGVVNAAIVSAIVAALVWLFIDQVDATLAAVTFGGCTLLFSVLAVGNLRASEYAFHDDHVAVSEGFLTVTEETVPYDRITDVGFTKTVWQRLFGVGTIRLHTAGSDGQELEITYVDDPEAVYEALATLIGEASNRDSMR